MIESIKAQFEFFSATSYVTLGIVILCFIYSNKYKLQYGRKNTPLWTIVISNISFWYFIDSVPGNIDLGIQTIIVLSAICLVWYYWIVIEENEENEGRTFAGNGKKALNDGYSIFKGNLRNKATQSAGNGFLSEVVGSVFDVASNRADQKVGGFLSGLFGNTNEYVNISSRTKINMLRKLILSLMAIMMFYI